MSNKRTKSSLIKELKMYRDGSNIAVHFLHVMYKLDMLKLMPFNRVVYELTSSYPKKADVLKARIRRLRRKK